MQIIFLEESQTTIETMRITSFKSLEIKKIQKSKAIFPKDFNLENTYNLFSLFIPEYMWQIIKIHTNLYINLKNAAFMEKNHRLWYPIYEWEVRTFVGCVIYMVYTRFQIPFYIGIPINKKQ